MKKRPHPARHSAPDNSVRAVARTLQVLGALSQHGSGASVSDVALHVGLNRATTHRYLRALEEAGAVSRSRGGYHLGPLVFELGRRVPLGRVIAEASRAPLLMLTNRFGEATHASIMSGSEAEMVAFTPSYRSESLGRRAGIRRPPYQGSSGKVLLAAAPAAELHRYLASTKLQPLTTNTITSPAKLLRELDRVREQGYAINRAEHVDGHTSVAVPVCGFDGEWLAAIALSAPSERMNERLLRVIIPALKEASILVTNGLFRQTVATDPPIADVDSRP
jgi:IclR family transcriptional regulator, pca regulon regulatory protein